MISVSCVLRRQAKNFMAEGLGTLKVHTTHVLVDFLNFNVQSMFHDHSRC